MLLSKYILSSTFQALCWKKSILDGENNLGLKGTEIMYNVHVLIKSHLGK